MKKIFILFCLCFLTALSLLGKNAKDPTLIAASFNILMAPKPTSNTWNLRRDKVAKTILQHKFDIFGTQEGFLHQLMDIKSRTGFEFVGHGREDGISGGEHSAIFYNPKRFELLDSGDFWLAENPSLPAKGWDAKCKRICSWGKFRDKQSGKIFYFFSLHMDHRGKNARKHSIELILKKIPEISGDYPFFCVGDFNIHSDHPSIAPLFKDKRFVDSMSAAKTKIPGPSGTFHKFKGEAIGDRIDYIFVSPGTEVLSYEIITQSFTNADGEKIYPSDHFPVAVRCVL